MKKLLLVFIAVSMILTACSTTDTSTTTKPVATPTIKATKPVKPATTEEILARVPNVPRTFNTAKKRLYNEIYTGHQRTLYCDCKFTKTRRVYLGSCGVKARKNERRAKQLEAEHVMPAYHMGQNRACWRQKLCTDSKGKAYKGRKCCEKTDKVFRSAHNDLHNLYPTVGEINGDRSNYKFGMIAGEVRAYGQCDFEVDKNAQRAEPADHVKGNIARTYFYMSDTYGIPLAKQQRQLFQAWSNSDPVDDWERERNQRIKKIQGNANPYIR